VFGLEGIFASFVELSSVFCWVKVFCFFFVVVCYFRYTKLIEDLNYFHDIFKISGVTILIKSVLWPYIPCVISMDFFNKCLLFYKIIINARYMY
jgi:hypothetical protein